MATAVVMVEGIVKKRKAREDDAEIDEEVILNKRSVSFAAGTGGGVVGACCVSCGAVKLCPYVTSFSYFKGESVQGLLTGWCLVNCCRC